MYSGLAMFNIHQEGDGSLSDKTYLMPNQHFDTSDINTKIGNLFFNNGNKIDDDFTFLTDAQCGCSKPTPNGQSQFPFFKKVDDNDVDKIQYFILGVVTDNTACFFETRDIEDLGASIDYIETNATYNNKIGFAHYKCPKYNVEDFKTKFGIHVLNKKIDSRYGWDIGPWNAINY